MDETIPLRTLLEAAYKREQFLRDIVCKFHHELATWGLDTESNAAKQSMCVFAGDWQYSVDIHIEEAAKRQEGE